MSIEDPLAEDDDDGFAAFTREVGDRVQIVGDDFLVTEASRVREAAAARRGQRGAAEAQPARHADRDARTPGRRRSEAGFAGIVSARSGETEDVTIVHLAVGWGVGQLKVGSFARSERMAKWNEALRIEEALGARGPLRRRQRCSGAIAPVKVVFHYAAGPTWRRGCAAFRTCDRRLPRTGRRHAAWRPAAETRSALACAEALHGAR